MKEKPFVGIEKYEGKNGEAFSYCFKESNGISSMPVEESKEYPWTQGIKGLAAMVTANFGEDFEDKITYSSPESEIINPSSKKEFTRHYEELSPKEKEALKIESQNYTKAKKISEKRTGESRKEMLSQLIKCCQGK